MHFTALPQSCADRVFDIIKATDGMQAIARLRLVSKIWLAAVQQYPGTARISSSLHQLNDLLHIMPNVSKLLITHFYTSHRKIDLTLLAQCLQLSSLELSAGLGRVWTQELITVVGMPSTLRKLRVKNLMLTAGSFGEIASSITSLKLEGRDCARMVEWGWLQHLPHLKVSLIAPCVVS